MIFAAMPNAGLCRIASREQREPACLMPSAFYGRATGLKMLCTMPHSGCSPELRKALPYRRWELDQIQFLLGHVAIQTTERYLGCEQKLHFAVNDEWALNRIVRRPRSDADRR